MDLNIMQIAVGVFVGNICTLVVLWCYKDFNRPDQENISWRALMMFLLIVGLAGASVAAQHWGL